MRVYTDTERLEYVMPAQRLTRDIIDRWLDEEQHGKPTLPISRDGAIFCWRCGTRLSKHYPDTCPACSANLKREERT